jgi:hypothetical protein
MIKYLRLKAGLALLLLPTVALHAKTPVSFEHEGIRYTYTVTERGGVRIIKGTQSDGAGSYLLRVGKRRVTGEVNGRPVSFLLSEVISSDKAAEVYTR